jgi:cytochrome P450
MPVLRKQRAQIFETGARFDPAIPPGRSELQRRFAMDAEMLAQVPGHVPPELVRYVGLTESAEFLAAPFPFMAGLHDTHPRIFYSPNMMGGAWHFTHHEDCYFALRHPEIFTTAGATPFPRDPRDYFPMIPLETDPPDHRKYRDVLEPLFSIRAISALQESIRARANALIDAFVDRGECEFTKEFGRPLPVSVFLDLMGLPQDMLDTFVGWAMGLLHAQDREAAVTAMAEVTAYLKGVIAEKRQTPDAGAVSTIVHARIDGRPLSDPETFGFVFFLFIAGLDTVFAALNNIFVWLAQHPDERRWIRDNPGEIDNVMEELLRVFTVTFSGRTLTRDFEMHGVKMKKGDRAVSVLPTANFDPSVFPDPRRVDFGRARKPTLAFAGGVHSCMGAHLARLEIKICIQEFLRRIPDFRMKDGWALEYWPGGVVGPKTVPLVW